MEPLILKGGLFLYYLSEFKSRPTMDIDFAMRYLSNTTENIVKIIMEILSAETENSYITFSFLKTEVIIEKNEYHGVRIMLVAQIKNTRTPFHIDLGIGDIIIPKPEPRELSTQLDEFEKPVVLTYSLESTIAEKFEAIISLMELSSRMKDYYDIYFLANSYFFEARKLQEAVFETLKHRGTNFGADTLEKVREFQGDKDMIFKWKHFIKTLGVDLPFSEVIETLYSFLYPIFHTIITEGEIFGAWNPQTNSYHD
jgi:predicted nucleotidyltransferase component of viral defense system